MPRVINSIHFNLRMNVKDVPPTVTVAFAEIDPAGREEHVEVRLDGQDAWDVFHSPDMLAAVNKALDSQAVAVDPMSVADMMAKASKAKADFAEWSAAVEARQAEAKALDDAIAAKKAAADAGAAAVLAVP